MKTSFTKIIAGFAILVPFISKNPFDLIHNIETSPKYKFVHFLLFFYFLASIETLLSGLSVGMLSETEFHTYSEHMYLFLMEFIMGINFGEINLYKVLFLILAKSFSSKFGIKYDDKKQRISTNAIGVLFIFLNLLMIKSYDIIALEHLYICVFIGLSIVLNILEGGYYVIFSKGISHLVLAVINLLFIWKISKTSKFPFWIFRHFIEEVSRTKKQVKLLIAYIKLVNGLRNIPEVYVNTICAICTDNITNGKVLSCKHVFHSDCLESWCEHEVTCPICRSELKFKKESLVIGDEIINGVEVSSIE